jgi:photosystem II stability/assembly factor-like uncharacterized protein
MEKFMIKSANTYSNYIKQTDKLMRIYLKYTLAALAMIFIGLISPIYLMAQTNTPFVFPPYQYVTPDTNIIPPAPFLKTVPGDGRITLYWDDSAEGFVDPFMVSINRNPRNFEGYKIYKSTDPEFLDALRVTDNQGNLQGYRPIAQFDRDNSISGYHPAAVNGMRYWLGNDTGIERFYVDEDVTNGRAYYYAVVAYTYGDALPNFAVPLVNPATGQVYDPPLFENEVYTHSPQESLLDIAFNESTGQFSFGRNVVQVTPNRPSAGYIEPQDPVVQRFSGSAGGEVTVQIIDPGDLKAGNEYAVTFQDTIIPGATSLDPDLVVTKSFSLQNLTTGEFIFDRDSRFRNQQLQIREGLLLNISNSGDTVSVNSELSKWTSTADKFIHDFNFSVNTRFSKLADYRIEFGDGVLGTSEQYQLQVGNLVTTLESEEVNFRVFNTTTNVEIPFAFFVNPQIPRDLRDVFFLNDQLGWTVGGAGQLRRTTNGGDTWQAINTGIDVRLFGVFFINENNGWVVGNAGAIWRTSNGGDNWVAMTSGTTRNLFGVYFLDSSTGVAIGQEGLILRTTDAGDTWTTLPAVTIRNLNGIYFSSQTVGHIVGDRTTVLRTDDAGNTWTEIAPANLLGGTSGDRLRNLTSVHFSDENNGWMVGFSGVIWNTTNAGVTWSRQTGVNTNRINKVFFIDAQKGWTVGMGGQILGTANGGATWALQPTNTQIDLFGLYGFDVNNAKAVGQGPTILNTSNGGTGWTQIRTEKRFRAFIDQNGQSRSDEIYFIEDFGTQQNVITWKVSMSPDARGQSEDPGVGDELELVTIKPFTSADEYRFTITGSNVPSVEEDVHSSVLKQIRVVPNPYVVTHVGEARAYGNNSAESGLHFTNLPAQCTIRIFNVSGQIVQTIQVDNNIGTDRYVWNMKNRHGNLIPPGIYIYYVEAPGIGEHTGKFAVIK